MSGVKCGPDGRPYRLIRRGDARHPKVIASKARQKGGALTDWDEAQIAKADEKRERRAERFKKGEA